MQVLQITSVPAKYEINIEHARLEYQQNFIPQAEVTTTPPELHLKTKNIQVRLDTYESRKSLHMLKIGDLIRENAQRGKDSIEKKIKEYVEIGQQMSEQGTTIAQIIQQKMVSNQSSLYTAFLPSGGVNISWIPNELDVKVQKGELNYDWKATRNVFNYVPGSVSINMIEYPRVDIQYTGTPIYFPRSADPNYVPLNVV